MHRTILDLARARPDVCGVRLYVEGSNRVAKHVYDRVGLFPSTYEIYESDFVLPHSRSADNELSRSHPSIKWRRILHASNWSTSGRLDADVERLRV